MTQRLRQKLQESLVIDEETRAEVHQAVADALGSKRLEFDEPVRAPAFIGIGDLVTHGVVRLSSSATPADPASGDGVVWMDSTSGDLKCKLNLGGTTKTATLADWSAL